MKHLRVCCPRCGHPLGNVSTESTRYDTFVRCGGCDQFLRVVKKWAYDDRELSVTVEMRQWIR